MSFSGSRRFLTTDALIVVLGSRSLGIAISISNPGNFGKVSEVMRVSTRELRKLTWKKSECSEACFDKNRGKCIVFRISDETA